VYQVRSLRDKETGRGLVPTLHARVVVTDHQRETSPTFCRVSMLSISVWACLAVGCGSWACLARRRVGQPGLALSTVVRVDGHDGARCPFCVKVALESRPLYK
jgi:hypothetical protein